jgi:histidine triad (HIT) family protein
MTDGTPPPHSHARSLTPCSPNECVFCRILRGDLPANRIYEDESAIAFLDARPYSRGHALVIPRRHASRLVDLDPAERHGLIEAVARTARLIERLTEHYHISANQGPLANQVVFHLHFHIIPRYGEGKDFFNRPRPLLTESDAREILEIVARKDG